MIGPIRLQDMLMLIDQFVILYSAFYFSVVQWTLNMKHKNGIKIDDEIVCNICYSHLSCPAVVSHYVCAIRIISLIRYVLLDH